MLLMAVVLVASAWVYQVRLVARGWVPGKARAEWLATQKKQATPA